MTPVLARPNKARAARAQPVGWIMVALVGAGAEVAAWRSIPSPSFVSQVVIDNPLPFEVEVEVSGRAEGRWLPLGLAADDQETPFGEVLDQGREWRFRFSSGGTIGGEIVMSRTALTDSAWAVVVPNGVADALPADAMPTPR